MLLRPFALATAGLAAATQAFLLPPHVSQSDVDLVDSFPDVGAVSVPQNINLNVSCPGCLRRFEGKHRGVSITRETMSHLELAFAIEHTPAGDRLVVNDFSLYPEADPFVSSLRAPVVPDASLRPVIKELKGHRPRPCPPKELGYQLNIQQEAANPEDGLALYSVDLQIIEVGDVFLHGIPNVHIKLVKDITTGALAIGGIEMTESENGVSVPTDEAEECTTFLCRWLATLKDNMAKMKGKTCHGKIRGGAHGIKPHHGGNHHHNHKGHHPHKTGTRHDHSWAQLLKNIGQHILLPVAVGIITGISVSLIGLTVGTLIVSIWRVLFRRPGQRHRASLSIHKASKEEVAAAEAEEKAGLVEHQDAPPSYDEEAVPAYEDAVGPNTHA